ncbi:GDSL-type esterase/lipase family protein [Nocardia asiatica]|uniref:DUF459 domain-containing protein n=1 Tax=Nocardia asiatica TaxID=209252 RepID=UPI002453FBD0|nr:GDSL-type esterase/lipase family protein [Nocardia asiatica]
MTSTDTTNVTDRTDLPDGVRIGTSCDIAADVDFLIDPVATITVGDRVSIRRGTTLQANTGGHIIIGDDAAIGENVVISAMNVIRIGPGVGISNMVDIHDHNHRARTHTTVAPGTPITPWASGFEVAPITIGAGAIVSNKVTICAGVTIGQNARVGANAVVTTSLPPNTTALGIPAQVTARHPGPLDPAQRRTELRIGWFGTSLMEHLGAHNPRLHTQADLPEIGERIEVTERRHRGYVTALTTHWQALYPWVTIASDNHGEGGATSRDVLANLQAAIGRGGRWDLAVLGVGINDVWRYHQGRHSEAVDLAEYETNLATMLELLSDRARQVLVIGEPPMGWEPGINVPAANTDLLTYNAAARRAAAVVGAHYIDLWHQIIYTATCFGWDPNNPAAPVPGAVSVWSDGVHLSEHGDELLRRTIADYITEHRLLEDLLTHDRLDRATADRVYTR